MNSKQPARYIKARMGNDLKQKILIQNGIITEVDNKPKPSLAECARCQQVNPLENEYCSKCSYSLTPSAFDEIKEYENSRFRLLEDKFNAMESMMEKLIAGLGNITDQQKLDTVAQSLFSSGLFKTAVTMPSSAETNS